MSQTAPFDYKALHAELAETRADIAQVRANLDKIQLRNRVLRAEVELIHTMLNDESAAEPRD